MKISNLRAIEILDSKGEPTLKVKLKTDFGIFEASVPSGVSEGKYEALELRDKEKRYFGKGVRKAVENINKIITTKLRGKNPRKQQEIDKLIIELDGTKNKSRLGANALTGVSMVIARAGAASYKLNLYEYLAKLLGLKLKKKELKIPSPSFLLIEGGSHGGNELDFQEFMIIPTAFSFKEKLQKGAEIYGSLKSILKEKYGKIAINVGLEGGFTPPIDKTEKALDLIMNALRIGNYEKETKIALDIASSTFYIKDYYKFEDKIFTNYNLLKFYQDLVKNYPIISLEDPYGEEDWKGFKSIMKNLGDKVIIVGDDLLATNLERVRKAVEEKAISGLIIKPDQIGTISEVLEIVKFAKKHNLKIIVSHRGGDTPDSFISDLAVGIEADFIKSGAPTRGERVAKYNRLLEIEEGF